MDQLKLQLSKVNQLLNDTISEKCKQELIYSQHQQQQTSFASKSENLFRASLVPVAAESAYQPASSIWKQPQQQQRPASNYFSSSIDNLAEEYGRGRASNYAQLETPRLKQQYRSSMYNPNHHYYYLNAEMGKRGRQEQSISKSIDQLYSSAVPGCEVPGVG